MTLYLGIPDKEWSLHMSEAEELLIEDDIGTHILGVYPYGDRIYGSENGAPGLLCIYFDDPAKLLDPCNKDIGYHRRSIGQGCGPVIFMSLYAWVKVISKLNSHENEFYRNLGHLIPPMGAPLYEDQQLTKLMDLARDYLGARGWDQPAFSYAWPPKSYEIKYTAYLRMHLLLGQFGLFAPCLNKTWGTEVASLSENIKDLSEEALEIDKSLVSYYSGEIKEPRVGLNLLGTELRILIHKGLKYQEAKEEREALGQAVKNIYRSLL